MVERLAEAVGDMNQACGVADKESNRENHPSLLPTPECPRRLHDASVGRPKVLADRVGRPRQPYTAWPGPTECLTTALAIQPTASHSILRKSN